MASRTLDRMVAAPTNPIEDYDDERDLGNGYLVYLKEGYVWDVNDPGCTTRGFDTIGEVREALKSVAPDPSYDSGMQPGRG